MSHDAKFFSTTKKGANLLLSPAKRCQAVMAISTQRALLSLLIPSLPAEVASAHHPLRTGEIHELKEELRTMDRGKRKAAVKKVIAAMTVGKDVSMLFPDVVNCMQTEDLELKKLVYLYLINYAKTQPDLAIMAVNTFVR